jgi:hypothetical protein
VAASTVIIFDSTTNESFSVTHEADGLGRIVATVDISGAASIAKNETEYWTGWNTDGGLLSPFKAGVDVRSGGDVVRWALSNSTIPQDYGRWAVAAQYLNRIKIDGYINDATASPWDWLSDNVFPLVPISIARNADGTYPVIYDLDLVADDMVQITEAADFRRVGPFSQEGNATDTRNEFTLDYARRAKVGSTYKRRAILTPEPDDDDAEQGSNGYVKLSLARYKIRRAWATTSNIIYDPPTAFQILSWLSRLKAFVPETATYEADPTWGWLRVGRPVSITESGANQTTQVGWVVDRYWDTTRWVFVLLFDDDPLRDVRST